jgi:hypothetical protein
MDKAATALSPTEFRRHLFYKTSHSPSLAELAGYEKAKEIVDFCFIANPYYPTAAMLRDLRNNFSNLIRKTLRVNGYHHQGIRDLAPRFQPMAF